MTPMGNMLRETLEKQKQRELELQKEKQTMLLSVSHDIKTPLSAIKLYAQALSKRLYKDEQKQKSIADSINDKTDEIESFVSALSKTAKEDFLQLEVNNDDFYLSQVIDNTLRKHNALLQFFSKNCGIHNAFVFTSI